MNEFCSGVCVECDRPEEDKSICTQARLIEKSDQDPFYWIGFYSEKFREIWDQGERDLETIEQRLYVG
ncbi:MAG: hypothetical protein PHH16_04105 [Candidatus Gracilibacteria bacterium]|nr:hypothetical protein [Candidatus Gracilibacteria bacterium]